MKCNLSEILKDDAGQPLNFQEHIAPLKEFILLCLRSNLRDEDQRGIESKMIRFDLARAISPHNGVIELTEKQRENILHFAAEVFGPFIFGPLYSYLMGLEN